MRHITFALPTLFFVHNFISFENLFRYKYYTYIIINCAQLHFIFQKGSFKNKITRTTTTPTSKKLYQINALVANKIKKKNHYYGCFNTTVMCRVVLRRCNGEGVWGWGCERSKHHDMMTSIAHHSSCFIFKYLVILKIKKN